MSVKKLFLIFFAMLIIFLGTLFAIFYFDIGGTQKYVRDVPVLNKIIPVSTDLADIEDELSTYSYNKLLKYTVNLYRQNEINKKELDALKDEASKWAGEDGTVIKGKYDELNTQLDEALDEVIRLKEYENEYLKIKKNKEKQDQAIALNNTAAYRSYFETLYKNEATELYKSVIEQEKYDTDFVNYVSAFSEMTPQKAALVIEQLARTDFDVVIKVVTNLEATVASQILDQVDTAYASMITKSIANRKVAY
ncbi:MAG: hypothetical protein MJ244_02130 [Clostridia bacterium]|nr:hypothetical protein [Clostridia bacterium]